MDATPSPNGQTLLATICRSTDYVSALPWIKFLAVELPTGKVLISRPGVSSWVIDDIESLKELAAVGLLEMTPRSPGVWHFVPTAAACAIAQSSLLKPNTRDHPGATY
jgi:hypothetical protein